MSASTAAVGVAGLASRESFAVAPVRSRAVSRDAATPRRRGAAVTPVCMGRKAAKVAAKKQKGEAIRTKLYGKYGKLIVTAVKEGGGADPVANTQLAKVLADAARLSVPRDLVERNIKRATDTSQADFMELTYEAYGAGGVGIVIEVLSDNVNRAAADTKAAINKKRRQGGRARVGALQLRAQGRHLPRLLRGQGGGGVRGGRGERRR